MYGAEFVCVACGAKCLPAFVICPTCTEKYGLWAIWPSWLRYLAREEKKHRQRFKRGARQYNEDSFTDILGDDWAEDKAEFWARVSGKWEKIVEMRIDSVAILKQLEPMELAILLLHERGYSWGDIGEIVGITDNGAWSRYYKARKRLRALSAPEPVP